MSSTLLAIIFANGWLAVRFVADFGLVAWLSYSLAWSSPDVSLLRFEDFFFSNSLRLSSSSPQESLFLCLCLCFFSFCLLLFFNSFGINFFSLFFFFFSIMTWSSWDMVASEASISATMLSAMWFEWQMREDNLDNNKDSGLVVCKSFKSR